MTKTELSEVLHDRAVVTKQHYAESNNTATGLLFGVGLGNTAVGLLYGTAMSRDEANYVTFTGQNTTFTVDNESLYARFDSANVVDVAYQKVYVVTYKDTNKDGKLEVIAKTPAQDRFLGAAPKK